jgi:ABC-2 type transport system permease protein
MSTIKTFTWLVKRELWEHKGALVWAPMVVGLMMVLIQAVSLVISAIHGDKLRLFGDGAVDFLIKPELQTNLVAAVLPAAFGGGGMPLMWIASVCIFFFCVGTLFDERRDRSVLFWKSLPISDAMTILSKVAVAACLAPAMGLIIAIATAAAAVLMTCVVAAAQGTNHFGTLLADPRAYLAPIKLMAMLPVYAVWALPTVGWLMMVSALARGKPLLWAVCVPFAGVTLILLVLSVSTDYHEDAWLWKSVVGRLLGGLTPGAWRYYSDEIPPHLGISHFTKNLLGEAWQMFAHPDIWIGAVVGIAMIYVAIRLRRWRDDE